MQSDSFIGLKSRPAFSNKKLAIFGYPEEKYWNTGVENIEGVKQWGLELDNPVHGVRQKREEILHNISTLKGQSGSAII